MGDSDDRKTDPPTSEFHCTRVNDSTFVVHERDRYEEHPFIYVKFLRDMPIVVLSDTGCGGGTSQQPNCRNLKEYLETHPVEANHGKPLNPRGPSGGPTKRYLIICTHCHYDHILGIEQFQNPPAQIIAPEEGKSFINKDLPEHSLCKSLGIATPKYQVTQWIGDYHNIEFEGKDIGIQIIHTPGHTPDEVAWYDEEEGHLYVGDSFYERVAEDHTYEQAILFPKEGNITDYMTSLDKLLQFIEAKNADHDARKGSLRIGCGHVTASIDAKEILVAVKKLFVEILRDQVPVVQREEKRGEPFLTWREPGEPRFSVAAPERIMRDAQRALRGE